MKTESIRRNKKLSQETKVYLIARELRDSNCINDDLWNSILVLKDKHYKTILAETVKSEFLRGIRV